MKRSVLLLIVSIALVYAATANADVTVGVDPGSPWIGFMNIFELPSNGGGFVFNSSWGVSDLTASFSGPVLTLGPNSINDPSSFWYTPSGAPGAAGNKNMDANMYVEVDDGSLAGQNVTFTGDVLSNSLVSPYTSVAFIKDFAPDFSSSVATTIPLTPGVFSISLSTIADPTRHIQYGFETIGPDVWVTDRDPIGTVQVTAVPEPGSLMLICLGLFGVGIASRRRT